MPPTLPTFQQLYEAAKNEIQLRRPDLVDFNEGSVLDALAGAGAVLADEAIKGGVELFAAQFFDTAAGADLDALAQDRFGIARTPATAAIGQAEWTRDAAGAYVILAGTRFRATVGTETITVQSTAAVSVLATDTTVLIPVQATTTGRASNAAAGTLTEVVDVVLADPGATVTNPEPLAGGTDAETDEAFRARIRQIYSTLRRGTVAALRTGALSVPGVAIVTVDESEVETGGPVAVYIGDPDARSNTLLAAAVATELENWRAAGILVEVFGATREEKALALQVAIERGSDQVAVGEAVRAALVAYGDTLQPGQVGQPSRLEKACHDASALVVGVEPTTTAADLTPSAGYAAIRFVPEQISLTFTEV